MNHYQDIVYNDLKNGFIIRVEIHSLRRRFANINMAKDLKPAIKKSFKNFIKQLKTVEKRPNDMHFEQK